MNPGLIELKDVAKYYEMGKNIVKAVDGMDIKVNDGDFVAIMGPSGSGKCVRGDTEVILDNGAPFKIKDMGYKENKVAALDNKTGKINFFDVSQFYQRKDDKCFEVTTTSGKKIVATENHPFFTISEKGFQEISLRHLQPGQFIAATRKISFTGSTQDLNVFNHISSDESLIVADSPPLTKAAFKDLGVSRLRLCKKYNINLGTYDSWLRKNNIPLIRFRRILEEYGKKITDYRKDLELVALYSNKKVKIPQQTSPELLEIYGFIAGDGNIDEDGIKFTNVDKEVKDRLKKLMRSLFGLEPKDYLQYRTNWDSRVLVSFFKYVFEYPLIQKSNNIKLPGFVFKCTNEEIASFIKALFDCDSFVSKDKKEISITLASEEMIKQLSYLFLRFGIVARYSEKIKYAANTEQKLKKKYYNLSISGKDNLELYSKYIGFNSKFKAERLEKHLLGKSGTNVDVIPCGQLIRNLRRNSGIKIPRTAHKKLWAYETGKIKPSSKKLSNIISLLEGYGIETRDLKILLNKDVFWDEIKSIKQIMGKVDVYDITVPGAENFVANGFIIHNSTAMNLVGSLDLATRGDIYLDGTNIETLDESDLAQIRGKKIGFIFQQFNLIQNLTAKENVMLPMMFQGIPREEREDRAEELLEMVELGDRMEHYPGELSGGEQQRVAIARALANDPDVILADEPTGNLDTRTGERVMSFLENLNKKGKTVIMVTHDPKLAQEHAKIIYQIKDGKVEKKSKKVKGKWKVFK